MNRRIYFRRSALLCATILMPCGPLLAQASVRTGIDVSAEAEATRNPYLDQDSNDWVGAGSVEVRPWLLSETERDRIELEAFARGRAFTSGFDFEDSFGGSLRASHRASPRTNYYGRLNVASTSARSNFTRFDRGGFAFDPLAPVDPATPVQPVDPGPGSSLIPGPFVIPPLDDLTIIGLQGRSTTLGIGAGMNRQLDTRSSISVNLDYNRLWVSGNQISGYENTALGVSYSRRLNARTSVGFSATAGQSRYDSGFPKTTTLGAYVNAQHQLDAAWSLSGSLGVSSSQSPAQGALPEVSEVGVAGNLNVCRAKDRSRLCLGVSRSQQPSTLGQVRTSDAIDFSYSERLSARDRVDLYANYARSIAPSEITTPFDQIEIASVGATLTRVLNPRLDGYLFGRASRNYGGYLSDEPSLSFGIGIRASLGDRR